jgi:hypothetical protein
MVYAVAGVLASTMMPAMMMIFIFSPLHLSFTQFFL